MEIIKKDNDYQVVDKSRFIEEFSKIKNDQKILKSIKNGINNIQFQSIYLGYYNDSKQSIFYLKSHLRNEKCLTDLSKAIFKSFGNSPFVYELEKNNYSYFVVNTSFLKNEYLNKIIEKSENKKSYFLIKINKNDFREELLFNNLNKNNLNDMFNDICYKFIYFYILKINKPFKEHIKYKTLFNYAEINKIEKEIKKLNNELKKTFNLAKKVEINKKLLELDKLKRNYIEIFDQEYSNLI